ncbi:ADENINE/GUANINE PERMEASE AZG1 [Ceraceosorus bombacis]|uniref:ADENINE/GUANINE PERMEASE AZG1 n=1 Tax=Ceraceosorus bombacis TaxID=401625 RepID=A0A0P1BAP8_9BASI|nr:ADENINE/GUANINE PERMEASE AZG1 [Ceraceosorus bombacis]
MTMTSTSTVSAPAPAPAHHASSSALSKLSDKLNDSIAKSAVGRWFKLEGCGHALERRGAKFTVEVRAGFVTFAAMAYILSLNPAIVGSTGGPCTAPAGVDRSTDQTYQLCVQRVRQEYVVTTAALATLATFLMGALANLPLGLAPGLGVNAYFASVVGQYGQGGTIAYGEALAAVFVEGVLFFFLSLIGLRQWLARLIPRSLSLATGVGIGLFLAFIGIGPAGIGVVGGQYTDLVGLAGCQDAFKDDNGYCQSRVLQSPKVWLGVFGGGVFTALLLLYRVRGAFLWPILLVAIASWPRTTSVTLFPHDDGGVGDAGFQFFKQVATWTGLDLLGPQNIEWSGLKNGHAWLALISFLYIDALDTTGTLVAMSRAAQVYDELSNDFEGSSTAFLSDSFSISMGALMGSSPCTAFVDIPSWATGSTLIIVGSLMAKNAAAINWDYAGDAIPAFLTIIGIPFMYNIAYGLIAGIVSFILLHNIPLLLGAIHPKLLPPGWSDLKEPYSVASTLKPSSKIDAEQLVGLSSPRGGSLKSEKGFAILASFLASLAAQASSRRAQLLGHVRGRNLFGPAWPKSDGDEESQQSSTGREG